MMAYEGDSNTPRPPDATWDSQPLSQGERAELAMLRKEIEQLRDRLAAKMVWWPGQPVRAGAEPFIASYQADYKLSVHQEARIQALRRDARRLLDASGWQPPPASDSLAAELKQPREAPQYRIAGLAGWDHNVLLAGPRKAGKTQLAVNLAAGLSKSSITIDWAALHAYFAGIGPAPALWTLGRVLGQSECFMAGNIAYLNAEMDPDDWRDCFRALPAGSYDAMRMFPLHCRGVPLPVISNGAAREWFTGWLRDRDIEMLIIDTWGALCAKNGVRNFNDDAEARRITDGLDEIKDAAGVASLLVLIHMPHQVPGMKHLERFKGAGAVGDWADVLWSYVQDGDGTRYLSATGRARIEWPETGLHFDPATGLLSWGATGSREQTARGRTRQRILTALAEAGPDGMLTEPLVAAAGGHAPATRHIIGELAAEGQIVIETRGKSKIHRLPQPTTGQIAD